jgi:Na+/H+ antiporter NhaD/arsenite permease-like protein
VSSILIIIFIAGYIAIACEHPLKINKAASALITGVLCWTIYILSSPDKELINENLLNHLGEIASILFFLMGAMTIVELVDSYDGFNIITQRIKTNSLPKLLFIVTIITFFLSALLDNLTTTIVMLSFTGKLLTEKSDRWNFAGMVIIAANAGGAWSPLGDVTTTMLWIGGQITATTIILKLLVPSLACAFFPLLIFMFRFRKKTFHNRQSEYVSEIPFRERRLLLYTGIICLLFVPLFKTLTHLPPFMGMMLSLGFIWTVVSFLNSKKESDMEQKFSVTDALQRIDTPSILFFLGILLSVAALQSYGILNQLTTWLTAHLKSESMTGITMGLVSALVDNVPLVAAVQGMYSLVQFPTDHFFWELIAYATGTGGSTIIIGSAAGVAAMGILKIDFFWYLKKVSWIALAGFFAGVGLYLMIN